MIARDLFHGGGLAAMRATFPDAPSPWLDLSTGINPWPYPLAEIPGAAFSRLPDCDLERDAVTAMAEAWRCEAGAIALTPGSQAAIQLLPTLAPAKRVAVLSPTYAEHAVIWRAAGADVRETHDLPSENHDFDCVVIVHPNNPDGRRHDGETLRTLAAQLSARGGALIVDEAFIDLTPSASLAPYAGTPGLVILRSFGKFFGLAGLRLGALLAPHALVAQAKTRLGPWPVSGPALWLAARAYCDHAWQEEARRRLQDAALRLDAVLNAASARVQGGTDLFRWVETEDAHALWARLARRGIYVRRFAWSAQHLRIGIPAAEADYARLAEALDAR